jgi:hypothetical protein
MRSVTVRVNAAPRTSTSGSRVYFASSWNVQTALTGPLIEANDRQLVNGRGTWRVGASCRIGAKTTAKLLYCEFVENARAYGLGHAIRFED